MIVGFFMIYIWKLYNIMHKIMFVHWTRLQAWWTSREILYFFGSQEITWKVWRIQTIEQP